MRATELSLGDQWWAIVIAGAGGSSGGDVASGAPPAMVQRIMASVSTDFAVATQAVLYGMAIAFAACFLIALLHPGDRVIDAAGNTVKAGR